MKIKKSILLTSIISMTIMFLVIILQKTDSLKWVENKSYDSRVKRTSEYFQPSEDIAVILLDQNSLDWAKEELGWSHPWPRESYGKIIQFLNRGNAASVAFDIIFSEPSIYGKDDDLAFAKADADFGKGVHAIFYPEDTLESNDNRGTKAIDEIFNTAAKIATVQSLTDSDGVVRRARFYSSSSLKEPSLTVASLDLSNEMPNIDTIPKAKHGKKNESEEGMYVRFMRTLDDYFPYSADLILRSEFAIEKAEKEGVAYDSGDDLLEPEMFEGMHVFVGFFAPGLFDICTTPISSNYPGVGVHIAMMDTILQKEYLSNVSSLTEILLILIFAAMGTTIASVFSQKQRFFIIKIFLATFILVSYFLLSYYFFYKGTIIPVTTPLMALTVAFAGEVVKNYLTEGKQRRFLKNAFGQCLSPVVVEQISENPKLFKLGGKKVNASPIFTDIQKFSSFSELLSASQLVELLNYYLTQMSDIIIEEKGTVDKYEGDAIVAFVGAPVEMKDHASRACRAALKMKASEKLMNQEIEKVSKSEKSESMNQDLYDAFCIMVKNQKNLFTRIGINSGEIIAGFMGSTNKKNYTGMGNTMNLASRLEGVNKQYSTAGILISEHTRKDLGDEFIVRSLDRVQVVNVKTPLRLYELISTKENASKELCDYMQKWEEGLKAFEERKYETALDTFKELCQKEIKEYPNDKVAKYYINLIETFFIKGKYPTASDDVGVAFNEENGVFTLMQK